MSGESIDHLQRSDQIMRFHLLLRASALLFIATQYGTWAMEPQEWTRLYKDGSASYEVTLSDTVSVCWNEDFTLPKFKWIAPGGDPLPSRVVFVQTKDGHVENLGRVWGHHHLWITPISSPGTLGCLEQRHWFSTRLLGQDLLPYINLKVCEIEI